MLSGGPHFLPFSILLCCLPLPPFLPCGRSKLLRRNNDHPCRNRCEGGRLHHLPLPQRGLVEAGAVRPAGVPQRPDAVLDGRRRGWRKSSAEGPVHRDVLNDWQGRSTIPKQPEMEDDMLTLEWRTLNLFPGCTCPPGVTTCFQTLPDLLCSHPSFYTLPWTPAHLYFLYVHPLSACCGHLLQKKSEL